MVKSESGTLLGVLIPVGVLIRYQQNRSLRTVGIKANPDSGPFRSGACISLGGITEKERYIPASLLISSANLEVVANRYLGAVSASIESDSFALSPFIAFDPRRELDDRPPKEDDQNVDDKAAHRSL